MKNRKTLVAAGRATTSSFSSSSSSSLSLSLSLSLSSSSQSSSVATQTFASTSSSLAASNTAMTATSAAELNEVSLTVFVARDDFPTNVKPIDITYYKFAPQAAWDKFLIDVRSAFKIEYISHILDGKDGSQVYRILSLRQNGNYFVRQRETSSILEVLNTGIIPERNVWGSTKGINDAKYDLKLAERSVGRYNSRINELVTRNLPRAAESEFINNIVALKDPRELFKLIELVVNDSDMAEDPDVDVVAIVRIGIESLIRLSRNFEQDAELMQECFDFSSKILKTYDQETDIILISLQLVNRVLPYLKTRKVEVMHLLLDTIQANAPTLEFKPRKLPKRLEQKKAPPPKSKSRATEVTLNEPEQSDLLSVRSRERTRTTSNADNLVSENSTVHGSAPPSPPTTSPGPNSGRNSRNRSRAPSSSNRTNRALMEAGEPQVESLLGTELTPAIIEGGAQTLILEETANLSEANSVKFEPQLKATKARVDVDPNHDIGVDANANINANANGENEQDKENGGGHGNGEENDEISSTAEAEAAKAVAEEAAKSMLLRWKGSKGYIGAKAIRQVETSTILQFDVTSPTPKSAMKNFGPNSVRQSQYSTWSSRSGSLIKTDSSESLTGKSKRRLNNLQKDAVLQQSFACLYKILSQNSRLKEIIFQLAIQDEISEIVLACHNKPLVLEYYLWVMKVVFGEILAQAEDPTLAQASQSRNDYGSRIKHFKSKKAQREEKQTSNHSEAVVMALSLVAHHFELGDGDKAAAATLLQVMDDGSVNFKNIVRKGREMCGL